MGDIEQIADMSTIPMISLKFCPKATKRTEQGTWQRSKIAEMLNSIMSEAKNLGLYFQAFMHLIQHQKKDLQALDTTSKKGSPKIIRTKK